jgi:hypothetical protein
MRVPSARVRLQSVAKGAGGVACAMRGGCRTRAVPSGAFRRFRRGQRIVGLPAHQASAMTAQWWPLLPLPVSIETGWPKGIGVFTTAAMCFATSAARCSSGAGWALAAVFGAAPVVAEAPHPRATASRASWSPGSGPSRRCWPWSSRPMSSASRLAASTSSSSGSGCGSQRATSAASAKP